MALDVYVMPLWRFKVGDFRSPIEVATGIRPKIVAPTVEEQGPGGWFNWFRRRPRQPGPDEALVQARQQVEAIRRKVESENKAPIEWHDEGEIVYAEQSAGFEPLRAYARWLDCREQFPEFSPPPEGDYYRHPVWTVEVGRLSCPHLVEHDCYSGYYLPCEFERLVQVEPYSIFGQWPASRSVGSAPRLLRELVLVQSELQASEGRGPPADDLLAPVKAAYLQMREVVELSCRHRLPIIFWG
jgi:hypothetical protein